MRLHQEIVLGVGGVRALRALRIEPAAWHLNEGHSAFLLVERARELTASGTSLDEALDRVRSDAVFTIHTPVPAGNERFEADLVRRLAQPLAEGTGLDLERILELGRGADGDPGQFDMTAFSLRLTQGSNAVSRLHAETANATWSGTTSQPIRAITNGIHPPTWLGAPIRALYEDLGADLLRQHDPASVPPFWERIHEIPDRRLWDAHQRQKLELLLFCRGILRDQFARHGESPAALEAVSAALDPEILTIGFARRFATYKRASLLFYDFQRLANLVDRSERPIQLIFAGKAHPADRPGQGVIQEIFGHTRADRLRGRVFILEDYNMRVGRYLVQGVDVWLNNPRRPLEASGTSGMKAAVNGVVNLSVLDGWWDEGWNERNGWAIGGRETNPDEGAQDWADAQALYSLLENEAIPRYYRRGEDGLPHDWLALMKESIASTIWQFSTVRMLGQYRTELYEPAAAGAADAAATAGTPPSANLLTPVGSG
jgi:starch phosphorylase